MRKTLALLNLVFSTVFFSCIAMPVSFFDKKGERVHAIAHWWAKNHLAVLGITVRIYGVGRLTHPPYTLMCNHQSALDIFSLLTALPFSFKWIAKRELFRIPFLGWSMKMAGHISLDRENPREALKAINDAALRISEGASVMIFPEGTRSEDGTLLPFKKGGFTLALRAKVPIAPMAVRGTSNLQPKGHFLPCRTGIVEIVIGEPIQLSGDRSAKGQVMDEVRRQIEELMVCQVK
jgi:1-acyl-sn-glycerol-3-phosphate acyltransferase